VSVVDLCHDIVAPTDCDLFGYVALERSF